MTLPIMSPAPGPLAPLTQYLHYVFQIFVIILGVSSIFVFAFVQVRYCRVLCHRWHRLNRICIVREPSIDKLAKQRLEQRVPDNHAFHVLNEIDSFTALP